MSATYLNRRQLLKGLGAGAIAAGAAATWSPAAAAASDDDNGLVGGWNINIRPSGQAARAAVVTLGPGGVLTTVDSLAAGAVGVGIWKKQEDHAFVFKFTVYDFTHGAPGVAVVVSGKGTVSGNSQQGSFSVAVFGTTVETGTFDGTRMTL